MITNFSQSDYIAFFSLLLPLLVISFSAVRYVNSRKEEHKQQRFENYHNLIHRLVRAGTEGIGQDSQRAIIFELRNYPEYKDVTIRILEGLKEIWPNEDALQEELSISLTDLKKSKWF